jgi:hypothetical protein
MQRKTESLAERTGFELTEEPNWRVGPVKIETAGPRPRFGKVRSLKGVDIRIPEGLRAALLILVMSSPSLAIKPSVGRKFSSARPEV